MQTYIQTHFLQNNKCAPTANQRPAVGVHLVCPYPQPLVSYSIRQFWSLENSVKCFKFHSNCLKAYWVDSKAYLNTVLSFGKQRLVFALCCFVGHTYILLHDPYYEPLMWFMLPFLCRVTYDIILTNINLWPGMRKAFPNCQIITPHVFYPSYHLPYYTKP